MVLSSVKLMVHGALGAGTTDDSGEDFVGLHTGGDAGPRIKGCNCAGFSGDSVPRDAADGVQRLYGAEYKLWRLSIRPPLVPTNPTVCFGYFSPKTLMYIVTRACTMDPEEMAKKCDLKSLKMVAKKYGINVRCAKKEGRPDQRALPPEGLAELESSKA